MRRNSGVSSDPRPHGREQTIQDWNGLLARRRPPFVGREDELRQLQAAFEAAARGEGSLILLAGEPGMGKTAVCQQLASFVAISSGVSLVGHCYPEGSPGPPFVETFESYTRERDVDTVRAEMGPNLAAAARIVPMLRNLLEVELTASADPGSERLWLLSGVCECFRSIGALRPLLLVVEDLHDADRGTLDLLVHLARHLAGMRVLVVGTYRDVEVDRAHPLAARLAELRRVGQVERLQLRDLCVDEVPATAGDHQPTYSSTLAGRGGASPRRRQCAVYARAAALSPERRIRRAPRRHVASRWRCRILWIRTRGQNGATSCWRSVSRFFSRVRTIA